MANLAYNCLLSSVAIKHQSSYFFLFIYHTCWMVQIINHLKSLKPQALGEPYDSSNTATPVCLQVCGVIQIINHLKSLELQALGEPYGSSNTPNQLFVDFNLLFFFPNFLFSFAL